MSDRKDRTPGGPRRPGGSDEPDRPDRADRPARLPRARHRIAPAPLTSPAVEALLRRTRLIGDRVAPRGTFRIAGLPVLIAAVVAGGPGWTTYVVRDGDSLTAIARRHGTDARALALVNGMNGMNWVTQIEAGRTISVPVPPSTDDSATRRRAAASGLHPVDTSGAPALSYRVQDGDTISGIAERSGSSVRAVLAANGLRPTGVIRPGQLLVLPSLRGPGLAEPKPKLPRNRRRPVVHVVRPGDTVSAIAVRYGVPTATLLAANRLPDPDLILPHQKLILPGRKLVLPGATARPAEPVPATSAHVVRRGETVTAIARRYGVSVAAVLALNHLQSRTAIRPGRRLLVPLPGSTGSTGTVGLGGPFGSATLAGAETPSTFLGRTYPDAVTRAAEVNRAALASAQVPDPADVRDLIRRTAHSYRVDPTLALAVASIESGFDQRRVSPANAVGVMQVLPSTGAWVGTLLDRRLNLLSTADNVTAGVVLLATLTARHDEQTALAGYYQGLASVRRHGMFADTRRYVATVRTLKMRFR